MVSAFAPGDFALRGSVDKPVRPLSGYQTVFRGSRLWIGIKPGELLVDTHGNTAVPLQLLLGSFPRGVSKEADRLSAKLSTTLREMTGSIGSCLEGLNGHFAFAFMSHGQAFTATDHLGTRSVFKTEADGVFTAGTNLTDLADDTGARVDRESALEFLSTGLIRAPKTLYQGILRQLPGSVSPITSWDSESFWKPQEASIFKIEDARESTYSALRNTFQDLSDRTARVSVLFSGGDDSRIIAALAKDVGLEVTGIIFCDHPNREIAIAKKAAKELGVQLDIRYRPYSHYVDDLETKMGLVGPGIDLRHAHAAGLVHAETDPQPMLDGYFASFAKADYAPFVCRRIRGRAVGLQKLTPERAPALLNSNRARAEIRRLVSHLSPQCQIEWLDHYPVSDKPYFGFISINSRLTESLTPLMLPSVVKAIGDIDASLRINKRLYRETFASILGRAAYLRRSGGEILGIPPAIDLITSRLLATKDRLGDLLLRRDNEGPWPTQSMGIRATMSAARARLPATILAQLGILDGTNAELAALDWRMLLRLLQLQIVCSDDDLDWLVRHIESPA